MSDLQSLCVGQDEQIAALRLELKAWEKAFAAANGGRKAGREDIKRDAAVATKYREYDRLRRPQSKKKAEQQPEAAPAQSVSASAPISQQSSRATIKADSRPSLRSLQAASTPKKANSQFGVPTVSADHLLATEDEGQEEIEPTPAAIRMQLGPTPLKDGQILSLFDCPSTGTPSKPRSALSNIEGNIAATPSKTNRQNTSISESPAIENLRGSRTPASSGKRFMLDSFATPLKRKREDDDEGLGTPSSSMKLLATPAFLRRSNTMSIMDTLAEEAERDGEMLGLTRPRGPPFKKKTGFIRSLSSIIQGMRKQEDDMLDDEMEMMREMEEADDPAENGDALLHNVMSKPAAEVLVEDSQVVMPLGPDRAYESEESDDDGAEGQMRKPWKKKGLKRQTKRVMMRPVTHKAKNVDAEIAPEPDGNEAPEVVAETQLQVLERHDDYDDESDYSSTEAEAQRVQNKTALPFTSIPPTATTAKPEGVVKKAGRKINALAHTNFRRLKIQSQNSKANGRGRFRRK